MSCVFCHKEKLVTDIVYEDQLVMAFMDMDPINEGHVLVVPNIMKMGLAGHLVKIKRM